MFKAIYQESKLILTKNWKEVQKPNILEYVLSYYLNDFGEKYLEKFNEDIKNYLYKTDLDNFLKHKLFVYSKQDIDNWWLFN